MKTRAVFPGCLSSFLAGRGRSPCSPAGLKVNRSGARAEFLRLGRLAVPEVTCDTDARYWFFLIRNLPRPGVSSTGPWPFSGR